MMPEWASQLLAIITLLAVIAIVVHRLPKVDVGHSKEFLRRRFMNWFPLGLSYALLYMGRYNLAVAKKVMGAHDLMSNAEYGDIKALGSIVYGIAFLLNGPLTDRFGGKATMLVSLGGSAVMNLAMGLVLLSGQKDVIGWITVLYAINMYFQSFGAVAIVKVNSSWFHVRERGMIGGVFGILISLGLYFAYDVGRLIVNNLPLYAVFMIPAGLLLVFFVIDTFLIRDLPSQAGFLDFDTADASSGYEHVTNVIEVWKRVLSSKIVWAIALIEFCSGYLRAAVMDWYYFFANQTGIGETHFVPRHWGMVQCVAGIIGGMLAGVISDRVFNSRRGPVAGVLYGVLVVGSIACAFLLGSAALGWMVTLMMLAVIGVHGMLSGTASMDFGGKKAAGITVGLIDGFVYLGVGLQAVLLGRILPQEGHGAEIASNWGAWPIAMIPPAVIGFVISLLLWNAKPKPGNAAAH